MGEYKANMLASLAVAWRRDRDEPPDVLRAEEIKQFRHRIAHLSPDGVRQLYERAFEDCRLIYTRIPGPRKMQTPRAVVEAALEVEKLGGVVSVNDSITMPAPSPE